MMKEEVTAPITGLVQSARDYTDACFETLEVLDGTPAHPTRKEGITLGIVPTIHDDLVALVSALSSLSERLHELKNIIT